MEKLQKALQKARAQRDGHADDGSSPLPRAPARGADAQHERRAAPLVLEPDIAATAWSSLREFVPDHDLLIRNRVMTMFPNSDATPFDILRTKTRLLMERNGWTRMGITSPTAGCGKSTIAANMAIGFGRQPDMRAMLFEMDLRRPGLGKCLGLSPPSDITKVMRGEIDASEQMVRYGTNVAIAAATGPSRDPTSILLDRRTARILSEIEEDYAPDLVLFDLPPLLVSDDSRAFLKEVDCVLIVAQAEATTASQLDTCEREVLEQTNVLGTVLNKCRFDGGRAVVGNYDYE